MNLIKQLLMKLLYVTLFSQGTLICILLLFYCYFTKKCTNKYISPVLDLKSVYSLNRYYQLSYLL